MSKEKEKRRKVRKKKKKTKRKAKKKAKEEEGKAMPGPSLDQWQKEALGDAGPGKKGLSGREKGEQQPGSGPKQVGEPEPVGGSAF